jgi:hypothetical protein
MPWWERMETDGNSRLWKRVKGKAQDGLLPQGWTRAEAEKRASVMEWTMSSLD